MAEEQEPRGRTPKTVSMQPEDLKYVEDNNLSCTDLIRFGIRLHRYQRIGRMLIWPFGLFLFAWILAITSFFLTNTWMQWITAIAATVAIVVSGVFVGVTVKTYRRMIQYV